MTEALNENNVPAAAAPAASQATAEKRHQKAIGVVVSAKGDKTARVKVPRLRMHPKYGKYLRRDTKVAVHDPTNAAKVGDKVEITACRRMSKTKSWRLLRVIASDASAGLPPVAAVEPAKAGPAGESPEQGA